MAETFAGVPAISHAFAADVFADDAIGFELVNGTVRISFGVAKMVEAVAPSPIHVVGVGRLVITIPGAQNLAIALHQFLSSHGLNPSQAVVEGMTPQ